jgi:hypothetical protein
VKKEEKKERRKEERFEDMNVKVSVLRRFP